MVRDTEAGKDLDDIPSWKENIDSKITSNAKLSTKQREKLEVLLQKYQDVFKSSLEKPRPSSISYTLLIAVL